MKQRQLVVSRPAIVIKFVPVLHHGNGVLPSHAPRSLSRPAQRCVVTGVHRFVVDLARCDGMWLSTVDGDRIFDWTIPNS